MIIYFHNNLCILFLYSIELYIKYDIIFPRKEKDRKDLEKIIPTLYLSDDLMITYFSEKVNIKLKKIEEMQQFDEQQDYIESHMPTLKDLHNCKCPTCGAIDRFSFHCNYTRSLGFLINDKIIYFKVTVTRVICNSCSATHAILPEFIVPYKIMASESICKIVKEALSSTVLGVSKKLDISYELIYYYIALLTSFFGNVKILNNDKKYYVRFNEQVFFLKFNYTIKYTFYLDYYIFFKKCFLMTKFRIDKDKMIKVGMAKS